MIVSQKYACRSAMWIGQIIFTDENVLGYWEKRRYGITADPWRRRMGRVVDH